MPLPNFPQMSLISNGILGFSGISLASGDLLFQPNKAGFILTLGEFERGLGITTSRAHKVMSGRSAAYGRFSSVLVIQIFASVAKFVRTGDTPRTWYVHSL